MAYRNFFASVTGKRKGRKLAPPTCSTCGRLDGPKPLSVRSWTCLCDI